MKFIIHYNGAYEDSIEVTGDTLEEIQTKGQQICVSRGWDSRDCWSAEVDD